MEKIKAKKIGMTQIFDPQGNAVGVTVLELAATEAAFKPGEKVCIRGRSIGKGFAGNVKRFHTHRGPMSHGSKSHRIPGSIGSGTTPGRVWKGKKMPGRLGGGQSTVKNLAVAQFIPEQKLLLVAGSVPGKKGNPVVVRKAA